MRPSPAELPATGTATVILVAVAVWLLVLGLALVLATMGSKIDDHREAEQDEIDRLNRQLHDS